MTPAAVLALQLAVSPLPAPAQGPASIRLDGRDFAGVDVASAPERGDILLAGSRVSVWEEGRTQRLLLERDARITLGVYQLAADRAAVWIEPVTVGGERAEQVAVYLENASLPGNALGIEQQGPRLLVTGLLVGGETRLRADVVNAGRPVEDGFVREGERRLARFLAGALGLDPDLVAPQAQGVEDPTETRLSTIVREGATGELPPDQRRTRFWLTPDDRGPLPPAERSPVQFGDEGVVTFSAGRIEALGALEGETKTVVLAGGLAVQFSRVTREGGRTVQLTAERGVVFLSPASEPGLTSYNAGEVAGVYLEGDVVAQSGDYTLRGRRIFYDLRTERAVVLDAVFWTYDEERGMPLYLRAETIRQESARQWTARDVRMANVGFAEPHFSIGATTVTLTRQRRGPEDTGPERTIVHAEGVTLRAGDASIGLLPRVRGEFKPTPLREAAVGSSQGNAVVQTTWDLYTLLGLDAAEGNEASLLIDGYFNRGPALGLDLSWEISDIRGSLLAYGIYDNGTDRLPSGARISQDEEFRGIVEAEQIWKLSEKWTLFLEGAYLSDETFLPAFFPDEAATRREFANSIAARYRDERSVFRVEARGTFNDFTPNEYLLQSQGYQVQRYPELVYSRVADPLFGGLISYSSDYSYSRMSLSMTEPTARELGYRSTNDARRALGLLPNESPGDALRAMGLNEDTINRFDTRHEIEAPLTVGALNVVPFAVGRFTYWDDDFSSFNNEDNDEYRLWGAAGVRAGTTIQRVDDRARSSFFDLHRLRHLMEPSVTFWHAGTTIDQEDLPVYDDGVESIADGSTVRLGVRHTFQTMRGGAGRRRSVDWLIIDTNYVWSSSDVEVESPIGRFIEARPEGSNLGEFISNEVYMQVTDATALTNTAVYDFREDTLARITAGVLFDHGMGFWSFIDYRAVDSLNASFLDFGARYELTRKYAASFTATVDFRDGGFQEFTARLERRLPQWTLEFSLGVDTIADDVSFGVFLRPAGIAGESRARVWTRDLSAPSIGPARGPGQERLETGPFADR